MSMYQHPQDDYYATNYRSYSDQNPTHKLDHYISVVDKQVRVDAPLLLDVGCGLGAFLHHASTARPDWHLFGTDIQSEAIERLSNDFGDACRVEVASAESRPFSPVDFDVITAWDVLEHLPDPRSTMAAFAEWLTPEGSVIFVVPVYDGITGPIIRRLDKDPTHIQMHSRDYWVNLANDIYTHVSWHGILRYLVLPGRYVHLPTRRFRRTTPAILVVASNQ